MKLITQLVVVFLSAVAGACIALLVDATITRPGLRIGAPAIDSNAYAGEKTAQYTNESEHNILKAAAKAAGYDLATNQGFLIITNSWMAEHHTFLIITNRPCVRLSDYTTLYKFTDEEWDLITNAYAPFVITSEWRNITFMTTNKNVKAVQ